MALTKQKFTAYLKNADFKTLFIEEMGWNKVSSSFSNLPRFTIGETTFNITNIAQRSGFQVLVCSTSEIPTNAICRKLDTKLRKAANDYICIFVKPGTEHHQWVAPVRTNEKRDIVIIEYSEAEKAQFLFEKIEGLSFRVDEETTIVDVKERVQGAFAINSERITKEFYAGFSKQHEAFSEFISGIEDETATKNNKNKQWYTSVMLNRLMFCYFIQKKGFLNGDENYLRNKLHWVKEQRGDDKFFKSFYKGFLVHLFQGGLNSPNHDSSFEIVYGRIPYLNGGMFDIHQLERDYADIDIKDEAFESLFEFFDKWRWHLDTRVTASGKDINPDVLGYIFEQYINDRAQMGAYYTKEDITEYIGRNVIIPYLLKATYKKCPDVFSKEGPFWSFVRQSGDEYIYDAVKKGAIENIPSDVLQGVDTSIPGLIERRKNWNNPTPSSIGLPSEIWRETIERLERYNDLKLKISEGKISSWNDFVTYNLNLPKLVYDFLNNTSDKSLIEAFYSELVSITVLDPTCGSGAFLFAALNLLEPLYEVCISKMEEINSNDPKSFVDQLSEIKNKYRSNIQYFIYKSIILRNLYGVDIMPEAVEIAKLRLFLKMVAVVEVDKKADNLGLDPLPDVDFNIRCGNTLVGYATEEQLVSDLDFDSSIDAIFANQELKEKLHSKLSDVADTYEVFRLEQFERDVDVATLKDAKRMLNEELSKLNTLLNKHLFKSSGYESYSDWLDSHMPFHWMAEFYLIMHGKGGFDVIIGNPPYIEYSKVKKQYTLENYQTIDSGNIYAQVLERCRSITREDSVLGWIVPISIACTERTSSIQQFLAEHYQRHIASFDIFPAKLFEGAAVRVSIIILSQGTSCYTSKYYRWLQQERGQLFQSITYSNNDDFWEIGWTPRINNELQKSILNKLYLHKPIARYLSETGKKPFYVHRVINNFIKAVDFLPYFKNGNGEISRSDDFKLFYERDCEQRSVIALLNTSLFYWYWRCHGDGFHCGYKDIYKMPCNLNTIPSILETRIAEAEKSLMKDFDNNSEIRVRNQKKTGRVELQTFFIGKSKKLINQLDVLFANYYGLSDEELDFIINYDIKYRLGEDIDND